MLARVTVALAVHALILGLAPPAGAVAPGNDALSTATVVAAIPFAETIDTNEATAASDDPFCAITPEATVWYSFTPPEDVRLSASTLGSDYDTVLGAYTGSSGALTEVACNDDAGGGFQSRLQFDAVAGTTYHFMIGSYDFGGQLQFALDIAKIHTVLRLTTSRTWAFGDQDVIVKAHLDAFADTANQQVSIFAEPQGGTRRLLVSGSLDAAGDFSTTVRLNKTTVFQAEWAGDEQYFPETSTRKKVFLGVKSGLWFGTTAQNRLIEFTIKNGTKVGRLYVNYVVPWDNCPGVADVTLDLRFDPKLPIRNGKFVFRYKGVLSGTIVGTFKSRSRAAGTIRAAVNDPQIGCHGDLGDGKSWRANNF